MTTAKPGARAVTVDLLARLRRHYIKPGEPLPGGVFVPEVGWNGGAATSRCDALYVGFTSTSGRILVGHEVKATRSDWLRELDKAGKADPWADQCHAWYVVAPSVDVVKPDEVPAGWGLMVPSTRTSRRMDVKRHPIVQANRQPSWDAVRSILARNDTLRAQVIDDARDKAHGDARGEIDQRVDAEVERRMRQAPDAEKLRARLTAIEEALGAHIIDGERETWRKDVVSLDDLRAIGQAARAGRSLHQILDELARPWANPLGPLRRQLEELEQAVGAVQAAAREARPEAAS